MHIFKKRWGPIVIWGLWQKIYYSAKYNKKTRVTTFGVPVLKCIQQLTLLIINEPSGICSLILSILFAAMPLKIIRELPWAEKIHLKITIILPSN